MTFRGLSVAEGGRAEDLNDIIGIKCCRMSRSGEEGEVIDGNLDGLKMMGDQFREVLDPDGVRGGL
mgnify:CR=1 FL=1